VFVRVAEDDLNTPNPEKNRHMLKGEKRIWWKNVLIDGRHIKVDFGNPHIPTLTMGMESDFRLEGLFEEDFQEFHVQAWARNGCVLNVNYFRKGRAK